MPLDDNRGSLLRNRIREKNTQEQSIRDKLDNSAIRPTKDEGEQVNKLLSEISDDFRAEISQYGFTDPIVQRIEESVKEKCSKLDGIPYETQKRIEKLVINNIKGLGPIQAFMDDPDVTEIVVQSFDNICIERNGIIETADTAFIDEKHLQTIINRIIQPVGRSINLQRPMVDARLQDGSRVNATIPPATPDGATLTIRKFSNKVLTGESYIEKGSISPDMLEFLSKCVEGKVSFIVSGGTNTGKTTLLNMLSGYIPRNELIITIEDSCELKLRQPNVRRMETRTTATSNDNMMVVDVKALVKNSLRMRPDRIIVGEIRDNTIADMVSAMSTGHEGSMCTVHANNPQNLIRARIPNLYAGLGLSKEEQNVQVAEAIELIIQVEHSIDGSRKVSHVTHVAGLDENKDIILKDIFVYDDLAGYFKPTGYVPEEILSKLKKKSISIDKELFDSTRSYAPLNKAEKDKEDLPENEHENKTTESEPTENRTDIKDAPDNMIIEEEEAVS